MLQRYLVCALLVVLFVAGSVADGMPKPPKNPARVHVEVAPVPASPGSEVEVTLELEPVPGIKITRYPKIKLTVPARERLVGEAEAEVGNDEPPLDGDLAKNYFKKVQPLKLTLRLDDRAEPGEHEVRGQLRYFYCVTASGFCTRHQTSVAIPLSVKASGR